MENQTANDQKDYEWLILRTIKMNPGLSAQGIITNSGIDYANESNEFGKKFREVEEGSLVVSEQTAQGLLYSLSESGKTLLAELEAPCTGPGPEEKKFAQEIFNYLKPRLPGWSNLKVAVIYLVDYRITAIFEHQGRKAELDITVCGPTLLDQFENLLNYVVRQAEMKSNDPLKQQN